MPGDARPFGAGAPRLWTIPPGAAFLGRLAAELAQSFGIGNQPDALSDMVIYLPNRRSARTLSVELFRKAGGNPVIMPDIRTLGDTETGETPGLMAGMPANLLPPLDETDQLGVLVTLVRRYYRTALGQTIPASIALAAARELSGLLNQAVLGEGAQWAELEGLVHAPEMAEHWARSAEFLRILTQWWPDWLEENKVSDPFLYQTRLAEAVAEQWRLAPPTGPVLIAGSTGATPAGRILMAAALSLDRGAVVLPGLDRTLSPKAREDVLNAPSHPQNTLLMTLRALGAESEEVAEWPGPAETQNAKARRQLINTALAPAEMTSDWRAKLADLAGECMGTDESIAGYLGAALSGLSLLAVADEASEAQAAALLMRETLEHPGKTAALISPDAGLGRRVAAELGRWGIAVPPSAGEPLGRTPCGSFLALCARLALDAGNPQTLVALLKHPYASAKPEADILDIHFLRTPRNWRSLDDLAARIAPHADKLPRHAAYTTEDAKRTVAYLQDLSDALRRSQSEVFQSELIDAETASRHLATLATALAVPSGPWLGEDGRSCAALLDRLARLAGHLEAMPPASFVDLLDAEMALKTVPAEGQNHPRLQILGPLEARLQSADLIILAGLNETVWPRRPPADSFLPRRFRKPLGLVDPDERVGLAAHDFAMLAGAPEVILMYAERRDDAPAVASRWVWRLQTLVRSALGSETGPVLRGSARWAADLVPSMQRQGANALPIGFTAKPRPKRRPAGWPNRLSVTQVDRMQRDPYALWAEHTLGLRTLYPLGTSPTALHRGTAIHLAVEVFEEAVQTKSREAFLELLRTALEDGGEPPENWISTQPIWESAADWFMDWRRNRDFAGGLFREKGGKYDFEIAGQPFCLTAQADRIELDAGGAIRIIDFKTGNPPSDKMIRQGFDPQLPLEALIAQQGGFEGVPPAKVETLEYVALKARPDHRVIGTSKSFQATPAEMASKAAEGLIKLISSYRDPDAAFLSAPRIQYVRFDYGFNLLARRAEWTSEMAEESDG